ncbi:MAG TPA: 23S rRNA (adenine(2503)-C(2))-methyltransferase RlmN, partial [Polyangiaceae bacterium]
MIHDDPIGRFPEEWQETIAELGERAFRAKQLFKWLHQRGEFELEKMSDLSVPFRARLAEHGVVPPFRVEHVHESRDGTRKLVLEANDGARVESVIIPMTDLATDADAGAAPTDEEDDEDTSGPRSPRVTLCISTQFGCAMGCVFCASGQAGLVRGLRASEIVSQVYLAKRYLREDEQLGNLVFMGMGEPLHHYDETLRALRLLTHPDGLGMSPRRITVSTVGLIPGIERLGLDFAGKIGLAISVHAPNDATRDRIIPMNRRYPLKDLMQALRAYPLPKRRRITIEYTLIDGVND